MLSGKPIFPGTSTMNQLERIVEVIGRPLSSEIDSMNILNTANILNSVPQPSNPRSLAHMCPNASTEALDCMRALLRFNPIDRISAENALEHPYVKQFHALEEEPVCSHKVNVSTLGSDGIRMSLQKLREKFFYDIGVIDGQILEWCCTCCCKIKSEKKETRSTVKFFNILYKLRTSWTLDFSSNCSTTICKSA